MSKTKTIPSKKHFFHQIINFFAGPQRVPSRSRTLGPLGDLQRTSPGCCMPAEKKLHPPWNIPWKYILLIYFTFLVKALAPSTTSQIYIFFVVHFTKSKLTCRKTYIIPFSRFRQNMVHFSQTEFPVLILLILLLKNQEHLQKMQA